MYNLLEYSSNYSNMTGTLWFYSKDEATNFNADIDDTNSFQGNTDADGNIRILKNLTIAVSLIYRSNFWRSVKMTLVNSKVELKFKWRNPYNSSAAGAENANANSNIIFTIKDTKLYVPAVTLSETDNQKL